jgi:hypothetical protein
VKRLLANLLVLGVGEMDGQRGVLPLKEKQMANNLPDRNLTRQRD